MNGRASPLSAFARALGGTIVGAQVLCPGPGHSAKDRSLSVRLSGIAPEGFVVHSHAGDDPLACRDYVRARMGWDRPPRFGRDDASASAAPPQSASPDEDEVAKVARAVAIWDEAVEPRGTVVERYLASRGLDLPWEAAGEALRFHPRCPWRDEATGQTIRVPAMIAAMRSIATEEITGVHRTRLTEDGRKVDRRMLGKASGAAVMLSPYSSIGGGLVLGEGIETCLSAHQLGLQPGWAMASVGAIASFPLLIGIDSLTLLAERGDGGASEHAIAAVGARYDAAGREVLVASARRGDDLNDALRRRCA